MLLEEPCEAFAILRVAGHDARPDKLDIVGLTNADDLAWILRREIRHGVVAWHARDACNQQRQGNLGRRVGAANHHGFSLASVSLRRNARTFS